MFSQFEAVCDCEFVTNEMVAFLFQMSTTALADLAKMAERVSTESIHFTASVPKAGKEHCAITVSFN